MVEYSLYFLALAPIWGYIFLEYFERAPNWVLGAIFFVVTILYFPQLFIKKKIVVPAYIKFMILSCCYYLIWGISDDFEQYGGFFKFLYKNPVLFSIFVFLLIENAVFNGKFIDRIIIIFKITIVAAFIVSFIQVFVIEYFLIPVQLYEDVNIAQFGIIRFPSLFAYIDPNAMGFSFLPIAGLVLSYDIYHKKRFTALFIVMSGVVALLSSTRYIQIGFFIILLQLLISKKFSLKNSLLLLLLLGFTIFLSTFFLRAIGFELDDYYYTRLIERTYMSRIVGINLFIKFFPQNPFFGVGQRVSDELFMALGGYSSQIHIGFLSHLYEWGIVGSFFVFTAWTLLTIKTWRIAMRSRFYGGFFGILVFLFANATLVEYDLFHYGIIFSLVFTKYFEGVSLRPEYTKRQVHLGSETKYG
ncbi:hypothetical protein JW935_19940 [candidate division KSB1 bacterium]|nr:hypothetical protein [candidate division KSB1 bacterium]